MLVSGRPAAPVVPVGGRQPLPPGTVATPEGDTDAQTLVRLQAVRALLLSMGVSDLSRLGTLVLPSGNHVVSRGLTLPAGASIAGTTGTGTEATGTEGTEATATEGTTTTVQGTAAAAVPAVAPAAATSSSVPFVDARHLAPSADGSVVVRPLSGTAQPLAARMLPQFEAHSPPLTIYDAYWAATQIVIDDDTNVILVPPGAGSLLIIAESISLGSNVNFTWTRPALPPLNANYQPGDAPKAPPQVPAITTSGAHDSIDGNPGTPGTPGENGDSGNEGNPGPNLEIWALELSGALLLDLASQEGQAGGRGQDGGEGGRGGEGGPSSGGLVCSFGPGSGGTGGAGGAAGSGGNGGHGGNGGQFGLYAPQAVLESYMPGGPSLKVSDGGGAGGAGGASGVPGSGGPGGQLGPWKCSTFKNTHHTPGVAGPLGSPGASGTSGASGASGMLTTALITRADFERELTAPAIVSLSSYSGHVGDAISLVGANLLNGDTVTVAGVDATTTISSNTTATFVVPDVAGGLTDVVIQRGGGDDEQSNPASFTVLPAIATMSANLEKNGAVIWGATVTLTGTGFASSCRVQVNGVDEPSTFVSPHTITFTLTPPTNLQPRETGESVPVAVLLSTGQPSNALNVAVATCRVVVIGDSVLWGEGLPAGPPAVKISDRVREAVAQRVGATSTFVDLLAHCGATIAGGTGAAAASSEIPDNFPTITTQLAAIADPTNVDLVVVNGGINDVGVPTILDPATSSATLAGEIAKKLGTPMAALLTSTITTCPNAQIVVTPYYPILSSASDTLLIPLLVGFLSPLAGIVTAVEMSKVVANCEQFFAESTAALEAAEKAANAAAPATPPTGLLATGGPRVKLAAPRFTKANATLAPEAWLFGIEASGATQDPMAAVRRGVCSTIGSVSERLLCDYASVGHPNPVGAQRYAEAVMRALVTQAVTFEGEVLLESESSNVSGPVREKVIGSLAIDDTDGVIELAKAWVVTTTVAGLTVTATLSPIAGTAGSFPAGKPFAGKPIQLPAELAIKIAAPFPVGTQTSAAQRVTLSTGGPFTVGRLPGVTGSPMAANGNLVLAAAGQLAGGLVAGGFTLRLIGKLVPPPS